MRSQPWVRPSPDAAALRRDVWLGLALAALSLPAVELVRSSQPGTDMGWQGIEGYLWGVALALPLCLRRRFPVAVMVVCALVFYAAGERLPPVALSYVIQISMFLAIWTAWAWAPDRRRLLVWTAIVFMGMFAWLVVLVSDVQIPSAPADEGLFGPEAAAAVLTFVLNALYFFGAAGWGYVAWRSARQREELHEQAELLRAQQAANERRAVTDERLRIARDLHDVVAHHVSGIGLQAAGARRVWDRDPPAAREALKVIQDSSGNAVGEMRQLVALLRTDEAPVSDDDRGPQPGLDAVDSLLDQVRSSGLDVRLRRSGEPFDVSATVGLSLYRTVQEALANVRRHSTASSAEVVLRWIPTDGATRRAVEVEVLDRGRPRDSGGEADAAATGWGLAGIRERAALHDGSVEIGPRPQGGFRVRVRVPQPESA